MAVESLRRQAPEQLAWLGAALEAEEWRLKVLSSDLGVSVSSGRVSTAAGTEITPQWRLLVLHYLCVASRPDVLEPEITFADLAAARTYVSVYDKRVTDRLCAGVGRDARTLQVAAAALGARGAGAGDVAFDLQPFPRLGVRVIWYAADEEFAPSATLLFPGNVESFFCVEDIVVLSERLVSRLCGKPF